MPRKAAGTTRWPDARARTYRQWRSGASADTATDARARAPTAEHQRLEQARVGTAAWRLWGPYVSERQWGTVREDYSSGGDAWQDFSHEQSRSRAYRWGEDGIAGISDEQQRLCFAPAFWNGADPILKERLFGLTGPQGNHGEDVKEYYFYLDNLPSHAYMKYLYKYPQRAYPYVQLEQENARRSRLEPEYELLDTGIFDDDRYFDIFIEYAKGAPEDLLVRISAVNRGPQAAPLHLLPTLWFRNQWSWALGTPRPGIRLDGDARLAATHPTLAPYWLHFGPEGCALFTDNDSNAQRLWGASGGGYVKDAFHDFVVDGRIEAVNPAQAGTKAALHCMRVLAPGETWVLKLRLSRDATLAAPLGADFDALFARRIEQADAFYRQVTPFEMPDDLRNIQRQAFAGLLWSKQYYHFFVDRWLEGDPAGPQPPPSRRRGRNHGWRHLDAADVLSVPDKWEYPWFAAWDMAFHCVAFALIDPDFAKQQLLVLTREWYMHPNGQIPAYEWNFGDVNPPVQAWAAIRVCQIEPKMQRAHGPPVPGAHFPEAADQLHLVGESQGRGGQHLFEGGFLGLDNVGAFDRSAALPLGGLGWTRRTAQLDGNVLLEHARHRARTGADQPAYEDLATKFFEHFVYIGAAVNRAGEHGPGLWHEQQGFYFDVLRLPDGSHRSIEAYTIAGLIPLFAIAVGEQGSFVGLRDFKERFHWFARNRPDLLGNLADITHRGVHERMRLALVDAHKLSRMLGNMLDPSQLLGPFGMRSVSMRHAAEPFVMQLDGQRFVLDYEPAESTTSMFGGNSNWRGPVWFPLNFLLIEALQKHDFFLGDAFKTRSGAGRGRLAVAGELRSVAAADQAVHARRRWPAAGAWAPGQVPDRSALEGPDPVPRVLPRRHRRRPGRQPPDRLDRAGGQADPAAR